MTMSFAMRNRLVCAGLAWSLGLGLTVLAGGEADAARKGARPCQPAGSKTVVAGGGSRVFTDRGVVKDSEGIRADGTPTILYGCRAGKRPVKMAVAARFAAGTLSFGQVKLSQGFASVVTSSDDRGGFSQELEVYDLDRRRRTALISPEPERTTPRGSNRFFDFVLRPSGNIAWIQSTRSEANDQGETRITEYGVKALQGGKTTVLDTGPNIRPRSLAESGSILYWINEGAPTVARLP